MIVSIICLLIASLMLNFIRTTKSNNPNGVSITIFQKLIAKLDFLLCKYKIISIIFFVKSWEPTSPKSIESMVWRRLFLVSVLSIVLEILHFFNIKQLNEILPIVICVYVFILQITLINSLLKPLFGVKRVDDSISLNLELSESTTVDIKTPKRSLLLALVNFFEIIISWGIIYRVIIPCKIIDLSTANYFSIVTITTVGYGDINGDSSFIAQTAITFNLIVFVIFSVCHITTILGTLTKANEAE